MEKANEKMVNALSKNANVYYEIVGKQLIQIELMKEQLKGLTLLLDGKDRAMKLVSEGYDRLSKIVDEDAKLKLEIKSIITKHNKLVKAETISQEELISNFSRFLELENKVK